MRIANALDDVTLEALRSLRDMGDGQRATGSKVRIPEKPGEQSLPAPLGGEGGSVPRTLGSKERERRERKRTERQNRRAKKKSDYVLYLRSETWRKIRGAALERDKHTCRACGKHAYVVHHRRYPKNLGEEKMEWLYSLCSPCHDLIHALTEKMTLREATDHVLALPSPFKKKLTVLEDDWQLSTSATRRRNLGKKARPPKSGKRQRRTRRVQALHVSASTKKKRLLDAENERLHELQKQARKRRAEKPK